MKEKRVFGFGLGGLVVIGLGIIVVLRPGGARVRLQHKHKIQLYVSDACGETCEKRKASDTQSSKLFPVNGVLL